MRDLARALGGAFLLALAGGMFFLLARPAECVYCPTYTCYGSCGYGCVCVSAPGEFGGECWGVEYREHFLALGMEVH